MRAGGAHNRAHEHAVATTHPAPQTGAGGAIESDPGGAVEAESTPGVFYLIQLEPEHDPGRFKIGFASNIDERLRSHRTVAPLCQIVKTWPCKPLWEKTAIDSVCAGYERLYTEVFRAPSLAEVESRCDRFFAVMPDPSTS